MTERAPAAVFVSYAREDSDAARRIAQALRSHGFEVWFDQDELRGGDAWDQKLRRQIKECALFVPVVSANTQERREGYFRFEWKLAAERTHHMAEGVPFVAPVVIDDTAEVNAMVPAEFMRVQWTRLPGARVTPELAGQVKRLLAPHSEVARAFQPVSGPNTGTGWKARATADDRSIGVLPFANMSSDAENEYFCDGIAEEITSALTKVGQLQVAGRTSAFSFKGKTGDLREIGHTLNVGVVLEGSVRKAGNRLRITAQLIKVADGYHLWSERYDRQLEDIFGIQDEIALAVVEALKVTLLGREKAAVLKRSTENTEAYQLCLKARHAWQRWTDEGFRIAFTLFNQALALDPNYALAHFGLGDCYLARGTLGREAIDVPKIRALIETAIRLDPDLAVAHAVLGALIDGVLERNWELAESRCRKAIAMEPRLAHIYGVFGLPLCATGRHAEAVAMFRRAVELDPFHPVWNAFLIEGLLGQRDWAEALRQAETTLQMAPDYWFALQFAGQAHGAMGQWAEAIGEFERAARSSGEVPYVIGLLGHALAKAGRRDEALQQLAKLRLRDESHFVPATALAYIHAGLGERNEACALLERALDTADYWSIHSLTNWPVLDGLRPDPRFQALVRRIGL